MITALRFLIFDTLTALWISFVFGLVFVGLPNKGLFKEPDWALEERLIGCLARSSLLIVSGVLLLSRLSLLHWFTLMLWYAGGLLGGWFLQNRQQAGQQLQHLSHQLLFVLFDALDRKFPNPKVVGTTSAALPNRLSQWTQQSLSRWHHSPVIQALSLSAGFGLVVAIGFTLLLRYESPLSQLRFSAPDYYQILLITRQFLTRTYPQTESLPIFSSLVAAVSLLGSVDPMHTLRFLGPLLGILVVLGVGYSMWRFVENGGAALAAMFSLGAYLFTWNWQIPDTLSPNLHQILTSIATHLNTALLRQWSGAEPELAALFVLLALTQLLRLSEWQTLTAWNTAWSASSSTVWINVICCCAIVAMVDIAPLILVAIGSIGLRIYPRLGLEIVAVGWIGLAALSALPHGPLPTQWFLITLPVGLSLLVGLVFAWVTEYFDQMTGRSVEVLSLVLAFALSVNFLLPAPLDRTYLEYEMAARKTLELNARYAAKRWMVVAPIEQLSETYGEAWYEDLANFVSRYSHRVAQPGFTFPYSVPDLFVFIEKTPFKTFAVEPVAITGTSSIDPIYLNYRSQAGRAGLQRKGLELCEQYRQTHPETSIEYEDEQLRIYHFHLPLPLTKG